MTLGPIRNRADIGYSDPYFEKDRPLGTILTTMVSALGNLKTQLLQRTAGNSSSKQGSVTICQCAYSFSSADHELSEYRQDVTEYVELQNRAVTPGEFTYRPGVVAHRAST